ncbi:hypothetical protein VNO78_02077 [Psophocarpus tetragonolobus]|uniref:Uncharacterized protein n=1 Tax=Psophocarpus tetragonolobus TaxID=3891 RepID=A0AAN9XUX5_PSOTE
MGKLYEQLLWRSFRITDFKEINPVTFMSNSQRVHALAIERLVPEFVALRLNPCSYMNVRFMLIVIFLMPKLMGEHCLLNGSCFTLYLYGTIKQLIILLSCTKYADGFILLYMELTIWHMDIIILDMELTLVMESSSMGNLGNARSMVTLVMTSLNMTGKGGSDETKKN